MPAQFTKHFVQDLQQDIKIRQCGTIVFNADNLSNVITVDLYNGTEPYSGGGTVAGAVICPDGATVALDNGTLTGNVASVTLKADCFAIPGQIGVGVQVISGSIRTTVLKAIYNVELLSTDNMVDPDSRITASVTQLVADIETATADIPASDMASLMSGIAPTFSASTNYATGAYVYYSGTLYRFTADHSAGSWTGTDAVQVDLGNDLGSIISTLKKAIFVNEQAELVFEQGNISASNGNNSSTNADKRLRTSTNDKIDVSGGFTITVPEGYRAFIYYYTYTSSGSYHYEGNSGEWKTGSYTDNSPKGNFIRVVLSNTSDTGITPSDLETPVIISNATVTDRSMSIPGKAADAQTAGALIGSCYKYGGIIGSETDLNNITARAVYIWSSSNRPDHCPTLYAGAVYCVGAGGSLYQIAINQQKTMFVRAATNSVWPENWTALATADDIANVSDAVATVTDSVSDLSAGLSATNATVAKNHDSVKTAFTGVASCDLMDFVSGGYKTASTPPTGKTISYNSDASNMVCAIISCAEGDIFTLNVEGPAGTSRGWMFADENMTCLSAATANTKISGAIKAPAKAAYLCVNNNTAKMSAGYYAFKGLNVPELNYALDGKSWGRANVNAMIRHILAVKWTPVAQMPKGNTSYYDLVEQTGIPYSSVRDTDKAVGSNVSIHTFVTAVRDPHSVLYTRKSNTSNADTYYGTVCSGLCNYAYGFGLNLTNYFLGESDWFETVPMQSIEIGDMLYSPGHVAMVSDITKDKFGRIQTVELSEEWGDSNSPNGRVMRYDSWNDFVTGRPDYIARRFKNLDGVGYSPIPYVQNFDEQPQEITYPDVQCDHGDAAVFVVGENVLVNVIDAKDYTTITVTRDGSTVTTKNTIQPFTLENVQAGLYTITASGGENTSVSTFYVVDCTGSFDTTTGELTFSSTNATPVLANVYDLPIVDGKYAMTCKPIPLTDEDRERGSINVLSYMDNEYQYAKVTFGTPYGQVDWYSETHQRWIPIP